MTTNALKFLNDTIRDFVSVRKSNAMHPDDLLSLLIAGYGETAKQQALLRDQVMTFLLAGHETTANGLLWALYYLSQRPEIWRKIEKEVDEVLEGRAPTLDDLKNLKYTRQVFDEVLRFHPIVWTISRDAVQDDRIILENGKELVVPRGTVVMMCTYAVHRREQYWQNPEAFDPERFDHEIARKRPPFSYFPFGGGQRQCLGIRFALVESVIALAMIAQRYRPQLISGQKIQALPNITLRPNGQVLFNLVPRDTGISSAEVHAPPISETPQQTKNETQKCPFHKAA